MPASITFETFLCFFCFFLFIMGFVEQKKTCLDKLYKPDLSRKGDVDTPLIPFIDLINSHTNFYTTSSCSGRMVLFTDNGDERKDTSEWLFVSHEETNFEKLKPSLEKIPQSILFFRFEGFILHVCAKTFEDAKQFLVFAQNHGYKYTGIIAATKRFIVQVLGVDRFDVPIAKDGKLLVSHEYISSLVDLGNQKLQRTHAGINRLHEAFKKDFF